MCACVVVLCLGVSEHFLCFLVFFFKQKTAYEMRISDWSSDVCSSDLCGDGDSCRRRLLARRRAARLAARRLRLPDLARPAAGAAQPPHPAGSAAADPVRERRHPCPGRRGAAAARLRAEPDHGAGRSEEHTSELQSLMRISYAVFCLKKKKR